MVELVNLPSKGAIGLADAKSMPRATRARPVVRKGVSLTYHGQQKGAALSQIDIRLLHGCHSSGAPKQLENL
jgi:hypothetical protein